ncbi:unnamed protein product [Schistosoma curassoni]|uniref:Reverse transcriptase domain-containing protein n=1 Tax=Schistosoma curassoni TaxID=6186 RepID=A0A183K2F4_9TREM|nr:unnamed protein product [Schistosoma curassoni]
MKTSTSEEKHAIQWTARNQLDDLDFADDLALLSHTHEQMQIKTASVAAVSASNSNLITLDGESLEDVESFTYMGSIIDEQGGSDADVKARIGKARTEFLQLKNIWNSKQLSTNIKVAIFNTNVKAVLLYRAETWRTTTTTIKKVQAFDSVDRTTLWKLLRYYGVPQKIGNIIQNSYDGVNCKIVHGGQLTDLFEIKTGVRKCCLLSPFLFLLVIDRIMKTSTYEGKRGIQWTSRMWMDDLHFVDDLALLSHTQQQMQEKTTSVAAASAAASASAAAVGLNIHKGKSKVLRPNTACTNPITIDGEGLEDAKTFTYLGSIIDEHDGSDADAKEKRNTKEHITARNGDRHEKNEQELDRTRKEGPGQSGL